MSSAAQAGNIKLVRGKWNRDFLDELEQAGPDEKPYDHDDQWDAASSAFNYLPSNRREFGWTPVRTQERMRDSRFPEDEDAIEGVLRRNKTRELGTLIKSRRWGPGGW